MRILVSLIFACLVQAAWAGPVEVKNVRIWAAPDSTRVVFDVSRPVEHEITLLTDPFRAVIDISDGEMDKLTTQPTVTDHYLRDLRLGHHDDKLRIVLDLKKYARTKAFQLPPNDHYGYRLVVDLYDRDEEATQAVSLNKEAPANKKRDVIIAVDAGHGGEDPGARGPSGVYEKDVVLQVAKKLADKINKQRGMRAVLTREGDYYIGLRQRIEKARKLRADLFISIHADAFRDPKVKGSSVYVLSQRGASSEHARWLAEQENASDLIGGVSLEDKDNVLASVLLDLSQTASLEASIDVADRVLAGLDRIGKLHKSRVESAAFAVLKSPDIPSILIETAYISNPTEERSLRNSRHQEKLADAIVSGLHGYFRLHAPDGTILAARKHVITRGDTLSTIAHRYRVSLESLRSVNALTTDMIHVGQVLTIPSDS